MVRTDLPGRRIIEPLILVPIFVSPMVLGFGYVVAAGPVGFFSQWAQQLIGFVPWNIYSMFSIGGHRRLNSRSACLSLYLFGAAQASAPTWKRRRAPSAPRRCR
ncbi:Ferric iron ABC transporter [Klebsiella pneumoniae]|nr:Ferric iron ABC transporter [Klebsiella pneumoniae]